jgi:hypothetical protein
VSFFSSHLLIFLLLRAVVSLPILLLLAALSHSPRLPFALEAMAQKRSAAALVSVSFVKEKACEPHAN